MVNLLDLPFETIVEILAAFPYSSLLQCRLVCSFLNHIILSQSQLQYIIELARDGMVDTGASTAPFPERLDHLIRRRNAWATLSWHKHEIVPFPGNWHAYEFVDGTVAKSSNNRNLLSVNLSSTEKESDTLYREDIGFDIRDFALDPNQDLIAYIVEDDRSVCSVYLHTISTHESHPKAQNPILKFIDHLQWGNSLNAIVCVQISGDILAVLASVSGSKILFIWNWIDGSLLVDTFTFRSLEESEDFTLLNSRFFIVSNCVGSGSLELYGLNYHPTLAIPKITHVASFLLPQTQHNVTVYSLRLHTGPFPIPSKNKIFTTSEDSRVLILHANYWPNAVAGSLVYIIHYRVFMQYINNPVVKTQKVRWEQWGPRHTLLSIPFPRYKLLRYVQGTKLVSVTTDSAIQVMDFNIQSDLIQQGPKDPGFTRTTHRGPFIVSAGDIFVNDVLTMLPYHLTSRRVFEEFYTMMINEEQIMGIKTFRAFESKKICELHVYSF